MPRKGAADDPLMTPAEVADYLNIPLQTLYNWRSEGRAPEGFKLGGHLRFRRSMVNRWLAEQGDTTLSAAK